MMSNIRSYLPEPLNENIMYGVGVLRCTFQPYLNTEFNANALETEPRILVGDLASASNYEAMHDQCITHVLCVLNGGIEQFPDEFNYMVVHINDDHWVDIESYFDNAVTFIDTALRSSNDSKILVHCQRGVSRSVTLVAAYLLYNINRNNKITQNSVPVMVRGVINTIHNVRTIASPNKGFVNCLNKYVCRLNGYEFPQINETVKNTEDVEVVKDVESVKDISNEEKTINEM
jgi:atypical dual specificity phosphatase